MYSRCYSLLLATPLLQPLFTGTHSDVIQCYVICWVEKPPHLEALGQFQLPPRPLLGCAELLLRVREFGITIWWPHRIYSRMHFVIVE